MKRVATDGIRNVHTTQPSYSLMVRNMNLLPFQSFFRVAQALNFRKKLPFGFRILTRM
jgi:hypothetical protein